MQFYKIRLTMEPEKDDEKTGGKNGRRRCVDWETGNVLSKRCEKYAEGIADKGYFFLGSVSHRDCVFGMIIRNKMDVERFVHSYIKGEGLKVEDVDIRETTLSDFEHILRNAGGNEYIYDEDEILTEYELDDLVGAGYRWRGFNISEKMIRKRDKKAVYLSAKNYFAQDTFIPELDRIYTGSGAKKAYGHPVDYLIESDDERTQRGLTQLLLQALYDVGRINNQRYVEMDMHPDSEFSTRKTEALYRTCVGGTVIVNFCIKKNEDEDEVAHGDYCFIEDLCKIIRRHCCDVLTIISLPRECTALRTMIMQNMGNCSFVEIKEELAINEKAVTYIRNRAKEYCIRPDKKLIASIEMGRGYLVPELNHIFDEWYSRKLKTTVYSQYKDVFEANTEIIGRKPEGSAYEELESMIGLKSAKKMIHQALDSYKARAVFKDKGICIDPVCNHMIFTGNPGTAKTTVARLFARIMKDNGVLSKGHIVEVGRSDLVGKYVGWTAPTVKKKFSAAVGGILFIDEAYSLVDDRDGMYGDEAINTIVQEMENHRDEVIVIFAGYPDKMKGFLDKNPGLRSRIAHYVHFEDYDTDELCQIASFIAGQKGMTLDNGAQEKIRDIMEGVRKQSDFGNGRFVRNVIEKARVAQNSRLVRLEYDSVTQDDVKTICAEDIERPDFVNEKKSRKIGFSVA